VVEVRGDRYEGRGEGERKPLKNRYKDLHLHLYLPFFSLRFLMIDSTMGFKERT
jgi:hypothetical protein